MVGLKVATLALSGSQVLRLALLLFPGDPCHPGIEFWVVAWESFLPQTPPSITTLVVSPGVARLFLFPVFALHLVDCPCTITQGIPESLYKLVYIALITPLDVNPNLVAFLVNGERKTFISVADLATLIDEYPSV